MRLPIIRSFALVAVIALAACATQAPPAEFGKEDAAQIRQLIADFVAAYNAKDVQKMGSLFSANSAIMPPNRSTMRGIDLVKSFFEGRWKDDGATNVAVDAQTIEGHGPIGFVAGTFTVDLKGPDGTGNGHDRGKTVWVVHKYAGQWKFDWQIFSSDMPPALPAAPVDAKPGTKPAAKK
jgi:ketosteroid isomerase-like protein